MSGSIAAIAAYNGSGTQGYNTTDKMEQGVRSVFWNESDTVKHFVNGSSFTEISANNNTVKSNTTPGTYSPVVFTFGNDSDAISGLVLIISRPISGSSHAPPLLDLLVDKIEYCVGNQVICTINRPQLTWLCSQGLVNTPAKQGLAGWFGDFDVGVYEDSTGLVEYSIYNLNLFKDNLQTVTPNQAYLMACANNQTLQVKVYPQNLSFQEYSGYTQDVFFDIWDEEEVIITQQGYIDFVNNRFTFDYFPFDVYEGMALLYTGTASGATDYAVGASGTPEATGLVDGRIYFVYDINYTTNDFVLAQTLVPGGQTAAALASSGVMATVTNLAANFTWTGTSTFKLPKHPSTTTFRLFGRQHTMTNAERDFLRNQVLPKRTEMYQYSTDVRHSYVLNDYLSPEKKITIDCDNFNICASEITILGTGLWNSGIMALFDVELFLNSSSYSGILPCEFGGMSWQGVETMITPWNFTIDLSASSREWFGSNPQAQDCVPLNRYDTIRIIMTPKVGRNTSQIDRSFMFFLDTLTASVKGYNTALYQNGAVTFNNY